MGQLVPLQRGGGWANLQRAVRQGCLGRARPAVQERVERGAAHRGYAGDWGVVQLFRAPRGGLRVFDIT